MERNKVMLGLFSKNSHIEANMIIIIIMPMSQVVKYSSSSFLQSTCAQLNPYGRQYRCEKRTLSCIHDKSILLLGHPDACILIAEDAYLRH